MTGQTTVEMTDDERDEFLATGGVGVLSFAAGVDQPPYSLPVSYGYDAADEEFYFRLAVDGEAGKAPHLDANRPTSFVTFDDTSEPWRSVVATGVLDPVDEDDVDPDVTESLRRVHIPLVDIFGRPTSEVSFRFFRMQPDEVTGRREVPRTE